MRVLVLAPVGRDGELLCSLLQKHSLECMRARDAREIIASIKEGVGTVVITEEVIRDVQAFRAIVAQIREEPEWSDLPIIALVSARATLELFGPLEQELTAVNLSLIERPARSETILRAVLSALRARRRQYQVRDFLADRLQSQENLWRTQKLESIGLLAGGIAHDFNNLLTGVIGNASLLNSTFPEGSNEATYSTEILVAAERSADLTRQLLAYSGKGKFVIEPISIPVLIKETAQLIRASLPANVTMRFDVDNTAALVMGDKTQLQQVVMNLMVNAGEAIPDGTAGALVIAVRSHQLQAQHEANTNPTLTAGNYIVLTVSDNGGGMSPETVSRVFEPFFTTKFLGRGLGLAAVSGIVRGHGGSIQVESRVGEGTTFTILLPLTEIEHRGTGNPISSSLVTGLGHVLVVDDENSVRTVAKAILENIGYQVSLAEQGKEALDFLRKAPAEDPIHLVILDWMMPIMDGPAAFGHLRREFPALPVIITSGYSEEHARASFEDSQVVGFLQKPFTARQLSIIVARAVTRSNSA